MTTTGTAENRILSHLYDTNCIILSVSIPGGVTNTFGTFFVPAELVSIALYVPVVAVVAVMVRVKLDSSSRYERSDTHGLLMV